MVPGIAPAHQRVLDRIGRSAARSIALRAILENPLRRLVQHNLVGGLTHSAVTGWTVCRFHGARGGGPKGERNAKYRDAAQIFFILAEATVEPFHPSIISLTIVWRR
jgi:hypothetical protein